MQNARHPLPRIVFLDRSARCCAFPHPSGLQHSPLVFQVSWQETEALPQEREMDSEAFKKHFSLPIHPIPPSLDPPPVAFVITKTWRSVLCCQWSSVLFSYKQWKRRNAHCSKGSLMLQLRPRAQQVNIKKNAQHCAVIYIKRINREVLQTDFLSSVNMGIVIVSTCPRLTSVKWGNAWYTAQYVPFLILKKCKQLVFSALAESPQFCTIRCPGGPLVKSPVTSPACPPPSPTLLPLRLQARSGHAWQCTRRAPPGLPGTLMLLAVCEKHGDAVDAHAPAAQWGQSVPRACAEGFALWTWPHCRHALA